MLFTMQLLNSLNGITNKNKFKIMYTYQLHIDGEIYSSRLKAHKRLCNIWSKDEETFLPIKENIHPKCKGWIEITYPNGATITKRPIL